MALTSGERAALWRKRQRETLEKHEEYKRKERERYKKRKESGKIKSVKDLTSREHRLKKKIWKTNQRNKRNKDKIQKKALMSLATPPTTPEHLPNPSDDIEIVGVHAQRANTGRKKKNLNRSKAYREQFKLRIELNKERRLREKYRKRLYRLKAKLKPQPSNSKLHVSEVLTNDEKKSALLLFSVIIKNIRSKYKNCCAEEKRLIRSLIYRENVLKKYKLEKYTKNLLKIHNRKRCASAIRQTKKCALRRSIEAFYQREDNSRPKAGKKSFVTSRGEKRQVRLLNDTLKNLHKKYVFETLSKMSYSMFASLRPFWIRHASEKDRETCLCRYHENPQLKANKLFHEKYLENRQLISLLENITCSTVSKSCIYRECETCKGKKVNFIREPMGTMMNWKVWKTKRLEREVVAENGEHHTKKYQMTIKEMEKGTDETLAKELQIDIERLGRHVFNINHQYNQLRMLKDSCSEDVVIVHIDFSENYMCKYEEEIQSMHFGASKKQVSIHTGMAYLKGGNLSFATVSDCLKHNPGAIWAHMTPVLKHLKTLNPNLQKIHFLSDGPTTQYRNKNNFYLFATRIYENGFTLGGSWNFLESGHGKGAPDGIGAVIKRTADSLVNATRGDITCSADIVTGLQQAGSKVKVFEVSEVAIQEMEGSIPSGITTVPKTMRLHQVISCKKGELFSRDLSCFCRGDEMCDCFAPTRTLFIETQNREPQLQIPEVETISQHQDIESRKSLLTVPVELDEFLVGSFCVVKYDGFPYPGVILQVDDDESMEVKVMHRIGNNRFFWPLHDDVLWYNRSDVVTILEGEPARVTGLHRELPKEIWEAIGLKLNL